MISSHRLSRGLVSALWLTALALGCGVARAAEPDLGTCRQDLRRGNYEECLRVAGEAVKQTTWDDEWPMLLAKAQLALGKYPEAEVTITNALERYHRSVQLRVLAYDVFNANGDTNRSAAVLAEISELAGARARSYTEPLDLVALGKAALLLDTDPKIVLDRFFDKAKRDDPNCREAYLASGQVALDKHDYQLAAKVYQEALAKFPDEAEAGYGLARAFEPSDQEQMGQALDATLKLNTNHVGAMVLLADHLVDAEQYGEAEKVLAQALKVNPWDPEAWAYRAVLANLRSDPGAEREARGKALNFWASNPRVDQLIGQKLSENYRFLEGSVRQRQALAFAPSYLPAKIQLSQDLLRLGQEAEGWRLADEVHARDGYDVTAYNLVALHSTLSKFQTLTNQDFIVRMDAREARIYGDRVLELLGRAKQTLSAKYGLRLESPTTIEIFPEQKDFAVRTFGVPHNPGFLGVCFGPVVTANSPASAGGHPANWEAVLWHEFCHVITLGLTKNKMPRWLSEGISVYEEKQENRVWGQSMNPRYREMILGHDLTPVGDLSSAFLSPKSDFHVQFAYYESSLVVEYLVDHYGLNSLKGILEDLGKGTNIRDAISKRAEDLEKFEKGFAAFAKQRAEAMAPKLDWDKPTDSEIAQELGVKASPLPGILSGGDPFKAVQRALSATNYYDLLRRAQDALSAKKWVEAKAPLEQLVDLYPEQTGGDSAYVMLAVVHRALNETDQERAVLAKAAAMEAAATDVFQRLAELDQEAKDWNGTLENAERFVAVNPLVPQPYRFLSAAAEQLGKPTQAIQAYRELLELDPPDPADVHYRLALVLHQQGQHASAKRHVLQALEEAPRFRDAQRLLLQIEDEPPSSSAVPVPPASTERAAQ